MANGHDVIALASRPSQTFGGSAGHPDRRVRLLHGPRVERQLIELPKLAFVADPRVAPGLENDVDRLAQPLAVIFPRDAEHLIVYLGVARADTELQSSTGNGVDHRVVLGAMKRMAQRQDCDTRTEVNFRRPRRSCGK